MIAFTIIGSGLALLAGLRVRSDSTLERYFLAYPLGCGTTAYLIFFLAAIHQLTNILLASVLVGMTILAAIGWWTEIGRTRIEMPGGANGLVSTIQFTILLLTLAAAFLLVLTPEIGKDAVVYHLAVPRQYLAARGFVFIPGNIFANLPFLAEMLYIPVVAFGNDMIAKGLHFLVLPALLMGMWHIASVRLRLSTPLVPLLVFVSLPTVFDLAHLAYVDLFAAMFSFAAVYSFLVWQKNPERRWLLICALFTGAALSTKYSAVILPILAILGILRKHHAGNDTRLLLLDLGAYLLVTIMFGIPFYLKNILLTGNPVYPFMYGIFGGKGLDEDLARLFHGLYQYMGMGRSLYDYLLLPWNISFNAELNSTRFDGMIGPAFLLLLPLLLIRRNSQTDVTTIGVYCLVSFLFWASSSQDLRYLVPVLPFLALLCGVAVDRSCTSRVLSTYAIAVICGSILFNLVQNVREFSRVNPLPFIVGKETRDEFLSRSLSTYRTYDAANRMLPNDARIFLVNMKNYQFFCEHSCYSDSMFETHTLQKILRTSTFPYEIRRSLHSMGFTHIMYDAAYITGSKSLLTTEDKQKFSAFQKQYLSPMFSDRSYQLCVIN